MNSPPASGPGASGPEAAQAVLTIDLAALAGNWRLLAGRVAPAECAAVVKADAYGIGIAFAVPALSRAGCRTFFVAHIDEGLRARAALAGAPARIFVLNGPTSVGGGIAALTGAGLQPVLSSLADIAVWREALQGNPAARPAALQIDTGMNRLGISIAEVPEALAMVRDGASVDLVMSHFVSSEMPDDPVNARQMASFASVLPAFPGVASSLSNSSGIFLPQRPFHDLVRPGYALYGGNPLPGQVNPMSPVVRLEAPILTLHRVGTGETVGYNGQWTARRPTVLATIGVGYADGIPRNAMATASKRGGEAVVAGVRCPFAGRVSMDLIVLDVTNVPAAELAPGVMAELLGHEITVDDLGARSATIGYEILTGLGHRYHRVALPG